MKARIIVLVTVMLAMLPGTIMSIVTRVPELFLFPFSIATAPGYQWLGVTLIIVVLIGAIAFFKQSTRIAGAFLIATIFAWALFLWVNGYVLTHSKISL